MKQSVLKSVDKQCVTSWRYVLYTEEPCACCGTMTLLAIDSLMLCVNSSFGRVGDLDLLSSLQAIWTAVCECLSSLILKREHTGRETPMFHVFSPAHFSPYKVACM